MYDIEIDYTTGNSFNSERSTELLCNPVSSISDAKKNLKLIKEHYIECKDNPNTGRQYELTLIIDDGDHHE